MAGIGVTDRILHYTDAHVYTVEEAVMSSVIISRVVENIRSGTNSYTPLIETIVNAIQAIEEVAHKDGEVKIVVRRSAQGQLDNALPEIEGFEVIDNGIGFTDLNREAFDTVFSQHKIRIGGKGFGRLTCLKYFDRVHVDSIFHVDGRYLSRSFDMGKDRDIIINEVVEPTAERCTGARVVLSSPKKALQDKGLDTIARTLVERLLGYFIEPDKFFPRLWLVEGDDSEQILLNDYINKSYITEIKNASGSFFLPAAVGDQVFSVKVFRIYSSKSQKSKINLVAHRREVTSTSLQTYVPEFTDEFFDQNSALGDGRDRNFIISVYVTGDYLDGNVSVERGGFDFPKESDLVHGIAQNDIEREASAFALSAVHDDIAQRQQRKRSRVESYVQENAPWYAGILKETDLAGLSYNPTEHQIDAYLHQEQFNREVSVKGRIQKLLESANVDELHQDAADIVNQVSESSRSELVHYIALRKRVLDIFEKSLQVSSSGTYQSEGTVHDILFPRRKDSGSTLFESHNLWIIDERLNFTRYLSSDISLDGSGRHRPDLIAYNQRVMFRGDNEPSNPVTIFEFKKPQRDDFANPSSNEDPVAQVVRYVNQVRNGKFKTPEGRKIRISKNTPFYGYIVCDLTPKVEEWLDTEKDFRPMPDGLGWFQWRENINLYIEVLSWDKVLKDAVMRNKIFFHKLGIE